MFNVRKRRAEEHYFWSEQRNEVCGERTDGKKCISDFLEVSVE